MEPVSQGCVVFKDTGNVALKGQHVLQRFQLSLLSSLVV